jgi:nucleoside-triphosphatase
MCPARIFLTGEPGCGKTTAIRRASQLLATLGIKPGGFISDEIRREGMRIGFSLEDLITHESGILAHVNQKEGPLVGKYHVRLSDIERVGVTAIRRAIAEADVVIVDELGPMELHSKPLISAVEMALTSPKHFLGTVHKRASHDFVTDIKSNPTYRIIEVTKDNRSQLPTEIAEQLTSHA